MTDQAKIERLVGRLRSLRDGVGALKQVEGDAQRHLGIDRFLHSRRLQELLTDPLAYVWSRANLSGEIAIDGLGAALRGDDRSARVVSTVLAAQMRNVFEAWMFVGVVERLADSVVELGPPLLPLTFEREIKLASRPGQVGWPTVVIRAEGGQLLALYLDSPLPYKGTSEGARRRSRPDIGVYCLEARDVVDWEPKRIADRGYLTALVECKESQSWPWTRKTIVDPWRGGERRIEVSHLEMVLLYQELYRPPVLVLASNEVTPQKAAAELEERGIVLLDEINFDRGVHQTVADLVQREMNP